MKVSTISNFHSSNDCADPRLIPMNNNRSPAINKQICLWSWNTAIDLTLPALYQTGIKSRPSSYLWFFSYSNKLNATAYLKTCKQYQQNEKTIFILQLCFSYTYPRQSWHYRGKDIWYNFYGLISLNRNRDRILGLRTLWRWRRVVFWEVLAQTDHSKIHNKNFFKPQNKPITDTWPLLLTD